MNGNTSGVIDANTITTFTGAAADVETLYNASGISGLGNEAITLSDTTITATLMNQINGFTAGVVAAASTVGGGGGAVPTQAWNMSKQNVRGLDVRALLTVCRASRASSGFFSIVLRSG